MQNGQRKALKSFVLHIRVRIGIRPQPGLPDGFRSRIALPAYELNDCSARRSHALRLPAAAALARSWLRRKTSRKWQPAAQFQDRQESVNWSRRPSAAAIRTWRSDWRIAAPT